MAFSFISLSSGSSGNCYLIKSNSTTLLVDAGISRRKIVSGLQHKGFNIDEVEGVFITHEHSDHVKGIKTLIKKDNINIYANEKTLDAMKIRGEADDSKLNTFITGERLKVGDIEVKSFNVLHDAVEPVGFSFFSSGQQISIITDTGCITDDMISEIQEADILVIEANHDIEMLKFGRYPWFLKKRILGRSGHLSNEDTGNALLKILEGNIKDRYIILAHLSSENNFPEMARLTIKNILESKDFHIGNKIAIHTIKKDEISEIYYIDDEGGIYCGLQGQFG